MMQREFVEDRKWLSNDEFVDLLGTVNLIPGPNSTQMAMFIGKMKAGWRGLFLAGLCFILPAALIVTGCAWTYVKFGSSPNTQNLLYGVKPVIIAIVAQATWNLLKVTVKNVSVGVIGAAGVGLALAGLSPLAIVFGSGACSVLVQRVRTKQKQDLRPLAGLAALIASFVILAMFLGRGELGRIPFGVGALFLFFLKVGSVLYGSGYSLLAYLNYDLVTRWGWLTKDQLLNAVAVGQFTPGPVFTTATFIGFILGGPAGAIAATVGIFLPSFIFIALSDKLVPKANSPGVVRTFLDGVNVASLAIMAVVALKLSQDALRDWLTVSIAVASLLLLVRYRINSAWLIAGGAAISLIGRLIAR
jgi:chromate transporter